MEKTITFSLDELNALRMAVITDKSGIEKHLEEYPDSHLKKQYEKRLPHLETILDKLYSY